MHPPHYHYITLGRIHNTEGYVHAGKYNYFRKDHLGNNREVWQVDGNEGATIQRTDYYPSGLPWADGEGASMQPYKHNSKEFIEMHGYDVTDHGNRGLYHAINRYTTMDKFAENFPWQSPYVHAANNPVNAIDANGDLPVFLVPIIKGAVGAVIDAAAQVTVSMANGQSFGQSLSNLDYTSVGASFLTSAIAAPGMSTGAKIVTGLAITGDALIDVSNNGKQTSTIIGGDKSLSSTIIDATTSIIPGKVVDNAASGFSKAISSDLGSNAAATLTKETKAGLKKIQSAVNGTAFQTGVNASADFTGGLIGGQINEAINNSSSTSNSSSTPIPYIDKDNIIQTNDATRVQLPH